MLEDKVKKVLAWLDPAAHPVVAFVPVSAYQNVKKEWDYLAGLLGSNFFLNLNSLSVFPAKAVIH